MLDQSFGLPIEWAIASAEIVERLDDPTLPHCLTGAFATLVSFDHCEQIVYQGESRPLIVYEHGLGDFYRAGLQNYMRYSYVLNPFYQMYRAGLASGVYRLRDLAERRPNIGQDWNNCRARQMAKEEIGYLTDGMPAGEEELCIGIHMGGDQFAGITLSRARSINGYSNRELNLLSSIVPFVRASYRRFWRQARFVQLGAPKAAESGTLQSQNIGRLSPREREIGQLLLQGHSTVSITLRLGISATTVKTHRKNLYAKLGIATQFELFKLFADSLGAEPAIS
jgi:DNA-binding CsgD family transcriptional regulator